MRSRVTENAEAHAQDPFLARRQAGQHPGGGLAQVRLDRGIERQHRVLVFDADQIVSRERQGGSFIPRTVAMLVEASRF